MLSLVDILVNKQQQCWVGFGNVPIEFNWILIASNRCCVLGNPLTLHNVEQLFAGSMSGFGQAFGSTELPDWARCRQRYKYGECSDPTWCPNCHLAPIHRSPVPRQFLPANQPARKLSLELVAIAVALQNVMDQTQTLNDSNLTLPMTSSLAVNAY
jgi:hypothetical protein